MDAEIFSYNLPEEANRMVPRQAEELCSSNAVHLAHSANQICIVGPRALGSPVPIIANEWRANNK